MRLIYIGLQFFKRCLDLFGLYTSNNTMLLINRQLTSSISVIKRSQNKDTYILPEKKIRSKTVVSWTFTIFNASNNSEYIISPSSFIYSLSVSFPPPPPPLPLPHIINISNFCIQITIIFFLVIQYIWSIFEFFPMFRY